MLFNNVHKLAKNVELGDEVVFVYNNKKGNEEQVSGLVSAADDNLNHVAIDIPSQKDVVYSAEEDSKIFKHDENLYEIGELVKAEIIK